MNRAFSPFLFSYLNLGRWSRCSRAPGWFELAPLALMLHQVRSSAFGYFPNGKTRPPSGGERIQWAQPIRSFFRSQRRRKKAATKERGAWGGAPKQTAIKKSELTIQDSVMVQ
jgi:hypothetical protein